MPFTSVLVAIDGSPPSDAALDSACSIVRNAGGRLTAVHVRQPHAHLHGRRVRWEIDDCPEQRDAVTILRVARERAQNAYGLAIDVVLADGDPVEQILAAARRIGADAIVIGSHSRGTIARVLLGSVAEGVVRASAVPVMVVHARPTTVSETGVARSVDGTGA